MGPWVIIGRLVSLPRRRLAATLGAVLGLLYTSPVAFAVTLPDSTWVALPPLPRQAGPAVFALAADPSNNQVVIAGTSTGALVRSSDGGSTWTVVHSGGGQVTTVAFNPFTAGQVLAGTQSSGALGSRDGGVTWASVSGVDGRSVLAFGFALTLVAAGTDRGVYVSPDGLTWTPSGLGTTRVSAIAVEAIHSPVRLVAGSDASGQAASVTLYQSVDSGANWIQLNPAISGTLAIKMVAGPLPPTGDTRPLLLGTNGGLFESSDNGTTFTPLSGGELLPSIDYTQIAFISDHFDRFYAASDGGGSGSGGLWRSLDTGHSFNSLVAPLPSISALAVSNDEAPILYVATFKPSDHRSTLWAYHDTGGLPQGPAQTPPASGARTAASPAGSDLLGVIRTPQFPYVALGVLAVMVILGAVVSHFRGRRH
jgi:hypothetical protein